MSEVDLVLEFEIEQDRSPNLENVARALLAWNDAVQTAVKAFDPSAQFIVELVGVEHGSQRFKQAFRRVEDFAQTVEQGGEQYPHIWKHTKSLAGCIATALLVTGITELVKPDPQTPVLQEIREILRDDLETRRASQRFYEMMQIEPAFSALELFEDEETSEPILRVPRDDFAHRSGLFDIQADDVELLEAVQRRTVIWEVVLVRPVLVGRPRRWTFARDGIEFSALMTDQAVLQALHDRTLPIPFAEGVIMQIEVSFREHLEGDAWIPENGTHKVLRVLSPRPPVASTPLLSDRP